MGIDDLEFPVIAFSPAGWHEEAENPSDLTDASPADDLSDWQRLEIFDASGRRYTAHRVYRAWPASRLAAWLCRITNHSIHVGMDLTCEGPVPLEELKQRIAAIYGDIPELAAAQTHKQLLELLS